MLIGITTTMVAGWRSCSCADKPKRAKKRFSDNPAANESWRRVLFVNSKQQAKASTKDQRPKTKTLLSTDN
jgi:hypothetical protein